MLKSDKKAIAAVILQYVIDETDGPVALIEVFANAFLMYCSIEKTNERRAWALENLIDILWQDMEKRGLKFRSFDIVAKIFVQKDEVWH